jgi:hypothetical protein
MEPEKSFTLFTIACPDHVYPVYMFRPVNECLKNVIFNDADGCYEYVQRVAMNGTELRGNPKSPE